MSATIDITPAPRILRTLGDIPFEEWQCFAELADNSLDALQGSRRGDTAGIGRVDIHWSSASTPEASREIVVEDNGPGMTLDDLSRAARAGYSGNDPIHNLGLFGMGFNIATARLGDETLLVSATVESENWVGVKIDFEQLIRDQAFSAPLVEFAKESSSESGTRVIVRRLKSGVFTDLKSREASIRRRLEGVYSPILEKGHLDLFLQGKRLQPRPHCVWGEARFVMRKGEKVSAVQHIDRDLGDTWFDTSRNRYLTGDESAELDVGISRGELAPSNIVRRSRRLKGWVGIQRFSDPSEFGIDFVRNGRKILTGDKALFSLENPDTGTLIPEYPVELGTTVGGRIVGEVHVDYLIPTYQKNGFDKSDLAWQLTVDALRGAGPILPQRRKNFGLDGDNTSPLGLLVNAYRRPNPGTKTMSLPGGVAREFRREFEAGNADYRDDSKWYRAVQEADKGKAAPTPDPGDSPTDDPAEYGPPETPVSPVVNVPPSGIANPSVGASLTSKRDDLIAVSERVESLTGRYAYGATPGFEITARRMQGPSIRVDGERVPYTLFQDGIEFDFFFDDTHPILAEYPLSPRQLLLQALAEKFSVRDPGVSLRTCFTGLVSNHLEDERINPGALKERAQIVLRLVLDRLPAVLGDRVDESLDIVREVASEEEELAENILYDNPELLAVLQGGGPEAKEVLGYVAPRTLARLIRTFPSDFMDGQVFSLPYAEISVGGEDMTQRLREASLEKVVTYVNDVTALLSGGAAVSKYELIRHSNTLAILEDRLA